MKWCSIAAPRSVVFALLSLSSCSAPEQTTRSAESVAIPGPPVNLTSPTQRTDSVTLSWSPPTSGGALDRGVYQVLYKPASSDTWSNGPTIAYCTPGHGTITDGYGNIWSIDRNTKNPIVNGKRDTPSHALVLLAVGGVIWQSDTAQAWYSFTPSGTIGDSTNLDWSEPTSISPLTSTNVSALLAATSYDFQVYVSNRAGNSPPASLTVSTARDVTGTGPAAFSPFITADFTTAMNYTHGGTGQQVISQRAWATSTGGAGDGNFQIFTNPTFVSLMAQVNPGLIYFDGNLAPGNQYVNSDGSVRPEAFANLVDNFYKIDPLGISGVVMAVNFDNVPGVTDATSYGNVIGNIAAYLDNYTMPNGKKFPLIGFMGHDEPDAKDEQLVADYYNAAIPRMKAVNPNLVMIGPNLSWIGWYDFPSRVPGLDVFSWDYYRGGYPKTTDPGVDGTLFTDARSKEVENIAASAATNLPRPMVATMVGGYDIDFNCQSPSQNTDVGAVFCARSMIQIANNMNVPSWGSVWDAYGDGTCGLITSPDQAGWGFFGVDDTMKITPKGYMIGAAVRTVYGPRWAVPTNGAGLYTLAVTPAAGAASILIVNAGNGAQVGQSVAFSSWPVNDTGNGTASVWQMSGSAGAAPGQDGTRFSVDVTAGVTAPIDFPDPSVTIISVGM